MKTRFGFVLCLGWALLGVSGVTHAKDEGIKKRLALNWKAEPQFGGYYAAELNGHFKSAGFEVELVPGGSGSPVVQVVSSGQADFGVVTGDEIPVAQESGFDVVALFAAYQTFPQGIMVHASHPAKSLQEVFEVPGVLALQKSVPYALFLNEKFKGKTKVKQVPYTGGIGAFEKDKKLSQQCFVTSEPLIARSKGLDVRVFLVADAGYNPYASVLISDRDNASSDATRRFAQAVQKGWKDYLANPGPVDQVMHRLNPSMSLAEMKASAEAQKPLVEAPVLGAMSLKRWEELRKILVQTKTIQGSKSAKDYFLSP
jgi:NitT/TauT family transport system substrate-binding protein